MPPRRLHPAAVVLAVAVVFALVVSIQNRLALEEAGRVVPYPRLFLAELVVWLSWAAVSPLVFHLSRRFPVGAGLRNLAIHLAAAPAVVLATLVPVVLVHQAGLVPVASELGFAELVGRTFRRSLVAFLPIYGILVAAERAWSSARELRERDLREARLEATLSRARLDNLRAQLHPHFLFNALHAISALMSRDVPGARRMIARLSDLLRLSIESGGDHRIPLARELDLLETYVEIQRLRFQDRLRVDVEVPAEAREVAVPRLLLQPLVENAVRHGVEPRARPGRVTVRAELRDGRLELTVADDGPGFPPEAREGVGLGNTRERLRVLYGEAASLTVASRPASPGGEGGGAEVRVSLPAEAP